MRKLILAATIAALISPAMAQQPERKTITIDGQQFTVETNPDGTYRRISGPNAVPAPEAGVGYMRRFNYQDRGGESPYYRTYDEYQRCWTTRINYSRDSWGYCTPEYFLPPSTLRMFRNAAKMEVEAPVYNPNTGKFEPLRPNEQ